MVDIKNIIGIVAIILIFIGYVPYYRDLLKGKTIPHVYSWILWGFVTLIVASLQLAAGAGIGGYVTLTVVVMCIGVIGISFFKHKGNMDITKMDTIFFVLAFISLTLWFIAKQPILSAVLATTTDLLGFVPTIRKSWNKPYSETVSFYFLNVIRFALATASLQRYSLVTALYPISWAIANGLFALMLVGRREKWI